MPALTSYSKINETRVDINTLVKWDSQFVPSSTGGSIIGPFFFEKVSANFSNKCGRIYKSGRTFNFEFGPIGVGYISLQPYFKKSEPAIYYSNCTGDPIGHSFWTGIKWFFGKIRYIDDRILIDGFCFKIIVFIDYWYIPPDITICPTNDAYVDSNQPGKNFGETEILEVNDHNGIEISRTYVKFDLSSIPNNATIHYALLKFFYCDSVGGGEPEVGIYKVDTIWDEKTVTWNNQPEFSSICEHHIFLSEYAPSWTEYWDITELVRGWKNSSIVNNGVVIKYCHPCENDITRRIFRSKEWIVENEKPVLIVKYY